MLTNRNNTYVEFFFVKKIVEREVEREDFEEREEEPDFDKNVSDDEEALELEGEEVSLLFFIYYCYCMVYHCLKFISFAFLTDNGFNRNNLMPTNHPVWKMKKER